MIKRAFCIREELDDEVEMKEAGRQSMAEYGRRETKTMVMKTRILTIK
jgi:hypothetical protein